MDFVEPDMEDYARRHTTPLRAGLKEVEERTRQASSMAAMLSGPVVGTLLAVLVGATGARRVLEVGTFTGFSALAMAGKLPDDGEVVTVEADEATAQEARKNFDADRYGSKVKLVVGDAHKVLEGLKGPFDLAFLDADKQGYPQYWQKLMDLVRPGGLIVVDNALWGGRVLDPQDDEAAGIARLNALVRDDPRATAVLLTVRDGVTIALRH